MTTFSLLHYLYVSWGVVALATFVSSQSVQEDLSLFDSDDNDNGIDRNNVYDNAENSDSLREIFDKSMTSILESEKHKIPSWNELDRLSDSRPKAQWYHQAKLGIFLHWGVFSVPSYESEWFWEQWKNTESSYDHIRSFVNHTERPSFDYTQYAARFQVDTLFNATYWANDIFAPSGAQFIVLTSKHHDGFCLWNSTPHVPLTYNWNAIDVGPQRDLVGELARAVKATISPHTRQPLIFGLYHSLFEWFHPLYLQDRRKGFNNTKDSLFVKEKILKELVDIVIRYHPQVIWSDGDWEAPPRYWKSRQFLYWLLTMSPVAKSVVYNDRWGQGITCHHGSFLTCADRYQPDDFNITNPKKWEDALTIDTHSWGYNRISKLEDYMTTKDLIHTLIKTVAWNGNMLLNVGPASDGTIHPIFVDRLRGIGDWLKVNGPAIYKTDPWLVCQNETWSNVFYTVGNDTRSDTNKKDKPLLYVHFTEWPSQNVLKLRCPIVTPTTRISFLGLNISHVSETDLTKEGYLPFDVVEDAWQGTKATAQERMRRLSETQAAIPPTDLFTRPGSFLKIQLPALTPDIIPCQHSWVLVMEGVGNMIN